MSATPRLCEEQEMQGLLEAMQSNAGDDVARIDALLMRYPDDPRLHFMRGSVLVGGGRPIEAHASLARAVEIAPDYAIARFQLGFFHLTSGEAQAALEAWGPLDALPSDHYLRVFAEGLRCLIRDEFERTIELLRRGQSLNQENLPLNGDMQLLIDRCEEAMRGGGANAGDPPTAEDAPAASATSLILGQFGGRS